MIKLLCLINLMFFSLISFSQSIDIKGKVFDENNNPLKGVNITTKDKKSHAQTNSDGSFSLTTSAKSPIELLLTSVGFTEKSILWKGKDLDNIKMDKKTNSGDDVVVIGYSTVKRKDLLASVSSVSAKDLKDIPINSAAEALNGRLAGVTATTAEGSPDADIRIRVRGGMSITGDNSPLYIIDGVQVENGLNSISPQDIQTIDVLKDASATAIYGARGGNGVIVITTKTGKPGKLRVSYNGNVGVKFLAKKLNVLSPYDYVIYQSERSRGSVADSTNFTKNFGSTWDTLENYKNQAATNWQDNVFGNTGVSQTHNVTANGGTNKMTYNFGYTYNQDKAIVINSKYQRHLINAKADYKITKKIKVGASVRYTNQNVWGAGVSSDKGTSYNRLRSVIKYRPYLSPNQLIDDTDPLADPNPGNGLGLVNPVALANAEYRHKTTDAINYTANITYNITKKLSFKSTFGFDKNSLTDRQYFDTLSPFSVITGAKKPIASLDTTIRKTLTNSNVFTYSIKDFRKIHDFDFLVGEETYDLKTEVQSIQLGGYPFGIGHSTAFDQTNLGNVFAGYPKLTKSRYTNLSFFGRANYALLDKYLISLNARYDGASKFAPGKQWGFFPAASVAWRVKKEKFLQDVNFISDLKFRVGYGRVGNNRISDYLYLTTFSNSGNYYYGINNQIVTGYYPSGLVNENLQWESTVNRNYGMDLSLLNSRLNLTVDLYRNTSKDLLLYVPIAPTYGYTQQYQNIGSTLNKGAEFQINSLILKKPNNLTWNSSFNISFNSNKVTALGVNQNSFFPAASWGVSGQPTDYIIRIGDPVGSMWGYVTDGFYKTNDFDYNSTTGAYTLKAGVVNNSAVIGTVQPGSIKFKDLNGDGLVTSGDADRQIIGNANPKFTGGFNNQFTYKQWDMSVFVNFSYGGSIYNANKIEFTNGYTNNANLLEIMKDRWRTITPTGQTAQWVVGSTAYGIAPAQLDALNAGATIWQPLKGAGAFVPHSWAIEDGSFLRLNNMTLGYTLPVKTLARMKMSRLRIYFTANNIAVITKYTGYDPEVSVRNSGLTPGLDYSAYPKSKSYIFGVNVSF